MTGRLTLSGVPVTYLNISDGASNAEIVFESPNPTEMDRFSYRTGASDVTLNWIGICQFPAHGF